MCVSADCPLLFLLLLGEFLNLSGPLGEYFNGYIYIYVYVFILEKAIFLIQSIIKRISTEICMMTRAQKTLGPEKVEKLKFLAVLVVLFWVFFCVFYIT